MRSIPIVDPRSVSRRAGGKRCPGWFILVVVACLQWPAVSSAEETAESQLLVDATAKIVQVLRSPRCMNCHPTGDRPRQGDEQRPHGFGVERGVDADGTPDDHGWEIQRCETCHHEANNPYSGVPGAPHWGLAPRSMGWIGLSDAELWARLIDPELNGGRSRQELVEHMSQDALVLWAWEPGENRTPPPVALEEFREALQIWLTAEDAGE